MGGGSEKPKQTVNDFYMSMHLGVCHGPVDAVEGIFYGEKLAWSGVQEGSGQIQIRKDYLFGGIRKEGGVRGGVLVLNGDANQVLPELATSLLGATPRSEPAYRGMLSLFFRNGAPWDGTYPDPNDYPDPAEE